MSETRNVRTRWGRTSWWIAGGVVFIIAVLAIVLLVNPGQKTDASPNGATRSAKAVTGCHVPVGDTSSNPAMPKDLRWAASKGWTWPVSDTYGPTQTKDGYGICFARSPLGAALALATIYSSSYTLDPKKTLELYLMDTPGKAVALSKVSTAPSSEAAVGPLGFAGFSTDSFSPNEAQITMVFAVAGSSTGFIGLPATVDWVDGDWKAKALDDGSAFAGIGSKPVAGQFVSWGGANG